MSSFQQAPQPSASFVGTVNTTNAVSTTILTIPVPTEASMAVRYMIAGRRTGGAAGAPGDSVTITADGFVKSVAGVVSVVTEAGVLFSTQIGGATAALVANGTNVDLKVTGAVDNNVSWSASAIAQNI